MNETGLKLAVLPADPAASEGMVLVLLKGTFQLMPDAPCAPRPEAAQREPSGDVLHIDELGRSPSWLTDFAPFKPHTDCYVHGAAYAPGGNKLPGFQAGFRLGPLAKTLQVWGPRHWQPGGTPTLPVPVARVPLRWELSAGGLADPRNPYGLGQDADRNGVVALPQVEATDTTIRSPADRPEPANFAPMPAWFPQRAAKAGTRDQRWALFRAPLLPEDYHPSFYNAAPFDQQAGNYPRGDEALTLYNLHPTAPVLKTSLPGLRPRVVLVRIGGEAEEVQMNLDTVVLAPDEDELVLLWRGVARAADPALSDVALVQAGLERLADPPSPTEALMEAAKARHAASRPADPAEQARVVETAAVQEARGMLANVPLPPPLRAMVETETNAEKLFDALMTHVGVELKRLGR